MTKKENILFNLVLLFLLIQPFFDILSNLYNYNIIKINLITYIKPFFAIATYLFLFFFCKYKGKIKQVIFYCLILLFIILHSTLLYILFVDLNVILREIRFMINIIYFITIFLILKNLFVIAENKKEYFNKLKKVLVFTIFIYIFLYIIAVVSGTSWLTYEFSDANKLGFRGWNYSGQIFGHLLSISLPFVLYSVYDAKFNNIAKFFVVALISIPFLLIGTKVPYFIFLIVNFFYILCVVIFKMIHHDYVINKFAVASSVVFMVIGVTLYGQSPVANNININESVSHTFSKSEDLEKYSKELQDKAEANKETIKNNQNSEGNISEPNNLLKFLISNEDRVRISLDYEEWTLKGLNKLNLLYASGQLHSADSRNRQMYFLHYKFMYASIPFKLLGLGYLNQPNGLSIERDIIMPLYCFGIIGFLLFTIILWYLVVKIMVISLKSIKAVNLDVIFLAEGYFMFFFISFFAGYTYIYTQFANVLAMIMILLLTSLYICSDSKSGIIQK